MEIFGSLSPKCYTLNYNKTENTIRKLLKSACEITTIKQSILQLKSRIAFHSKYHMLTQAIWMEKLVVWWHTSHKETEPRQNNGLEKKGRVIDHHNLKVI